MRLLSLAILVAAAPASADVASLEPAPRDREPSVEPPRPEESASAEAVAEAPRPGAESGRLDPPEREGAARSVGRGLLLVPRLAFLLATQPLRGALYLQSRLASGGSSPDPKSYSITPVALVQSQAGLHVGVRASVEDLLGRDERFQLYAGLGGEFHRVVGLAAEVGTKRISGGIEARFEQRFRERFYGYGNDSVSARPSDPIDPTVDATAVRTTYHLERQHLVPHVTVRPTAHLGLTARVALVRDETAADDEEPIDAVYAVRLGDRRNLYSELAASWDTRRAADRYDHALMHGTGGSVAVFGGRGDGAVDFYRAGIDLRRYLALTRGPRVLELRAYGETITGPRDQLPFVELARLGGRALLRGYDRDRFRDKVAAVTQVTYRFAIARFLAGSVFVDVGRVYEGLDALTYRDQRVGFGTALDLYSKTAKLIRAELASSIDGGLFAYVAFNN